jgi:hypothetical protein
MYLAALVGESPHVSTYFAGSADGVGGGGPTKKPTLKSAGKKGKATNLNRLLTSRAILILTLHGSPSFG